MQVFYDDDDEDDDYFYNYDNDNDVDVQQPTPLKEIPGRQKLLKRLSPPGGDTFHDLTQKSARLNKKQGWKYASPLTPRKPWVASIDLRIGARGLEADSYKINYRQVVKSNVYEKEG